MSAATAASESRDGKAAEAPPAQRRRSQPARSRRPASAQRKVAAPAPDSQAEEAADALAGADAVAIPSAGSLFGGLVRVVGQGRSVARETAKLGFEAARIVGGRSKVAPAGGDRRFADPAWTLNPFYRRLAQFYLAWAAGMGQVTNDLQTADVDWPTVERARFATSILVSALAPTNAVWSNPAALKRAFDTAGLSLGRGFLNWLDDLRHNGGMPSQADRTAFAVGRDLAVSPGSVISRDDLAELIQYQPTTAKVRSRPLLVVPPPIGRFYFLDLKPGRSFVEYSLGQELQTFMLSWRNPTAQHGSWDMDAYASRILDAIDSVREVTGSEDVNVIGFCAGGLISTAVLNHLAERRDPRVHSMSYAVTLLDFSIPAPIGAFSSRAVLNLARGNSRRKGVISAKEMGGVFTWMRPDDLVFSYWVNNYLMGEKPPAFDILSWNADGTNLPAALHEQFLDIFANNTMCRPGAMTVLGSPIDLSRITTPIFVTGAVNDHLTPWKGCYRTTQLFDSPSTFVQSSAGHIASLVNPPGNPKASYHTGGPPGPDPEAWLASSTRHVGSWWEPWAEWVRDRSGA
ncbi:MAG: alpha/beta fold hydrolase, partial [Candidatus Dormibacteraeota bacterium]|nr:alpha/beta fold hydrolase [Candidatus Dormibacteraeota bacterium]